MDDHKELLVRLTTDREWAQANEYDAPICLQDDLSAAITILANYKQVTDWLCANGFESFGAFAAAFEQVKWEKDAAEQCIYSIEDALDRGSDNDWAREAITEYEAALEGGKDNA